MTEMCLRLPGATMRKCEAPKSIDFDNDYYAFDRFEPSQDLLDFVEARCEIIE